MAWIWLDPEHFPEFQDSQISAFAEAKASPCMAVFRREIEVADPAGLKGRFSGDTKFRLWINGRLVADGPVEVGGDYDNTAAPDWWFHEERDLSEYFTAGRNELRAEVLNRPEAQTDYSTGRNGFWLELEQAGELLLTTDSSWSASVNRGWSPIRYDARGEGLGPEYPAWVSPEAARPTRSLDLPPLAETRHRPRRAEFPIRIEPGLPRVLEFDFGAEYAAHLELDLECRSGAVIEIAYQEYPGVTYDRREYVTRDGRQVYRATRMAAVKRVVLIVSCGSFSSPNFAPVILHGVSAVACGFPVETVPFACSDPGLEAARRCIDATMRMCMQRLHLDSPVHQEGLGCTGDYRIESLIACALYGEARLARADIIRTARLIEQKNGVMFHTSYSLLYFDMIREYVLFSGDRTILEETRKAVRLVLDRFAGYTGEEGLISQAPNYMFIDWIVDGSADYHHPPANRGMGPMTAFYIHGLETALELAQWGGWDGGGWRERAEKAKAAFRRELWRPERNFYADGLNGVSRVRLRGFLPPEDGVEAFSMHTNILAVAYGIAPENEADALLDRTMTDPALLQPQPYFMHYVFEALHRRGRFGVYGQALLRRWNAIVAEHPEGLKECWNCGDYSHAWGGTPAWQLLRGILGVEILAPGCRKLRVAPETCGLSFARGEFKTPLGKVEISWQCRPDGELERTVVAPEGIEIVT